MILTIERTCSRRPRSSSDPRFAGPKTDDLLVAAVPVGPSLPRSTPQTSAHSLLIRLDDAGRDAAAVSDLVALLASPLSDRSRPLAIDRGPLCHLRTTSRASSAQCSPSRPTNEPNNAATWASRSSPKPDKPSLPPRRRRWRPRPRSALNVSIRRTRGTRPHPPPPRTQPTASGRCVRRGASSRCNQIGRSPLTIFHGLCQVTDFGVGAAAGPPVVRRSGQRGGP